MSANQLDYSTFADCLNTTFSVKMGGAEEGCEAIPLELVEATESKVSGFSLMFKGNIQQLLPEAMHEFSHEKIDSMEIFISPCLDVDDQDAHYYEAVFNYATE